MTSNNSANKNKNTNTKATANENITLLASAIRTSTKASTDLLELCRKHAGTIAGRKIIVKAADMLLNDERALHVETLNKAMKKGGQHWTVESYIKMLDKAVDDNSKIDGKGAKNLRKNFLGGQAGHKSLRCKFIFTINYVLAELANDKKLQVKAPNGYKLVLPTDKTNWLFELEAKPATTKGSDNTPPKGGKDKDQSSADKGASNDNNEQLAAKAPLASVADIIAAIESLAKDKQQTLASCLTHNDNEKLASIKNSLFDLVSVDVEKVAKVKAAKANLIIAKKEHKQALTAHKIANDNKQSKINTKAHISELLKVAKIKGAEVSKLENIIG